MKHLRSNGRAGVIVMTLVGLVGGGLQAEPAAGVRVDRFIEIPKDAKPSRGPFAVPGGLVAKEDVVFAEAGGRKLKLDLYRPEGKGVLPGVVVVHGGGWTGGDKESFRPITQKIAAKGFVAVTIEYRLAGEAPFPAALHDCKTAVRWVRAHAGEFGIDSQHIGTVGGSAGGHLVALLATTGDDPKFEPEGATKDQSSAVQAVVVMAGGWDPAGQAKGKENPGDGARKFFGGNYAEKKDVYDAASPINHIGKGVPPVLFIEGELDKPGARYVEVRKKLDELGVFNRLVVVQGGKHGCWRQEPWMTPMAEEIAGFLKERLK